MAICDICGKERASRTLSGVGVCEKCFDGVIQKIRSGDRYYLDLYSDANNLLGASEKGLEYVNSQIETYTEKEQISAAEDEERRRRNEARENAKNILLSTTPSIDGYKVVKYIDIVAEEVLFNAGLLSKISNSLSDLVDSLTLVSETELSGSSDVLRKAKDYVKEKIRYRAALLGANAVIGIDLETSFGSGSSSAVKVSINGTAVVLEKE